jgi:hypothetical protein
MYKQKPLKLKDILQEKEGRRGRNKGLLRDKEGLIISKKSKDQHMYHFSLSQSASVAR